MANSFFNNNNENKYKIKKGEEGKIIPMSKMVVSGISKCSTC